jgi:hypothetical protein
LVHWITIESGGYDKQEGYCCRDQVDVFDTCLIDLPEHNSVLYFRSTSLDKNPFAFQLINLQALTPRGGRTSGEQAFSQYLATAHPSSMAALKAHPPVHLYEARLVEASKDDQGEWRLAVQRANTVGVDVYKAGT